MSRIRTIKPEFWTSEQVMECSPLARLLFIGMWNFCDDQGVHPASSKTLKAEIFPADDITIDAISNLVSELIKQRLVMEFENNFKKYWYVTGWKHQLIKNPSTPKYPAPPKEYSASPTPVLPQSYPSPTVGVPPVREGKGREGIVREEIEDTSTDVDEEASSAIKVTDDNARYDVTDVAAAASSQSNHDSVVIRMPVRNQQSVMTTKKSKKIKAYDSIDNALSPYREIYEAYNEDLPMLVEVMADKQSRRELIDLAWNSNLIGPSIENFRVYFRYIRDHCKFITMRPEDRPKTDKYKGLFKPKFDWIMNPENVVKIIEGTYEDQKPLGVRYG